MSLSRGGRHFSWKKPTDMMLGLSVACQSNFLLLSPDLPKFWPTLLKTVTACTLISTLNLSKPVLWSDDSWFLQFQPKSIIINCNLIITSVLVKIGPEDYTKNPRSAVDGVTLLNSNSHVIETMEMVSLQTSIYSSSKILRPNNPPWTFFDPSNIRLHWGEPEWALH